MTAAALAAGDIVRVRLSCHVYDHGRWVDGGLEVVEAVPNCPRIVVKRPGAQYTQRYIIEVADLTIGKGNGTSRASRRKYREQGQP